MRQGAGVCGCGGGRGGCGGRMIGNYGMPATGRHGHYRFAALCNTPLRDGSMEFVGEDIIFPRGRGYGFAERPMRKGRMQRGGRMISAPTMLNVVSAKNVGETCGLPRAHTVRPYDIDRTCGGECRGDYQSPARQGVRIRRKTDAQRQNAARRAANGRPYEKTGNVPMENVGAANRRPPILSLVYFFAPLCYNVSNCLLDGVDCFELR